MKVLFFLIFLMTVSASGASGEVSALPFYTFLDHTKWNGTQRIYTINVNEVPQEVKVVSECESTEKGEVSITNLKANENLVICMDFSLSATKKLDTLICYDNGSESEIVISSIAVVGEEHSTEPTCGVGKVSLVTPLFDLPWKCATPRPDFLERPKRCGVINAGVEAIDITQYLFASDDNEKGHFIRMSVQYSNLSTVKLEWGQEFYYGHVMHEDPETNIVGKIAIPLPRTVHECVIL